MRSRCAIVLASLFALLGPAAAAASGAWTTFIRAYTYADLLAENDTVWCATGEAGLLRYQRIDSSFVAINREPGGIASNSLSALLRDRSGRLWVGTLGAGASRLTADGTSWDLVNRFDGLPSDSVTALAARGDTVLIGTTRGIALWNGSEVTGALPDGFNPSPFVLGSDWMTGIVIHGDSVWVSTRRGCYRSRFSAGLTQWSYESQADLFPETDSFQGIAADGSTLIALSGSTPLRHDFDAGGSWAPARDVAGGGTIPPAVRIYQDRGNALLTTEQGVFRWTPAGWLQITSSFASIRGDDRRSFAVAVDPSGRTFAANQDGVYERFGEPDQWTLRVPPGPPGNNIKNLAIHGQRVYVNTFTEGIGRFDGREWRVWPFASSSCAVGCDTTFYAPNYALALLVDRAGKKWFGCWGQVIDMLDDSLPTPRVVHHRYLPPIPNADRHTCAWASAADSSGGRWFGMDTNNSDFSPVGLDYYDATGALTANFRPDSSGLRGAKIHGLTVDRGRRIWVGYTGQGIDFFDWNPSSAVGAPPAPALHMVSGTDRYDVQALVAHGDTVWALTTSELVAYNRFSARRIVSYPIPAAPGQLGVNPLALARDGTVWVGTVNGMRVIGPRGSLQDFDTANSPLADEEVSAIRVDWATGVVWIGTPRGLHRYDPGYRPTPPPPVPRLEFTIYPNPTSLSALGISLKLNGNSVSYRGEVYDLRGRRLTRFSGVGNQRIVWNGRTEQGDLVEPGIYFIRVESAGKSAFARVVVLR